VPLFDDVAEDVVDGNGMLMSSDVLMLASLSTLVHCAVADP